MNTSSDEATLYVSDIRHNFDRRGLIETARTRGIDSVRSIRFPAVVRKQYRRGEGTTETPTLSELGGGSRYDTCQVVATSEGLPISIDDVIYFSGNPDSDNPNHGTAAIAPGSFFSVGWKRSTENIILVYHVSGDSSELPNYTPNEKEPPIAQLPAELVGYRITNWRGPKVVITDKLMPLLRATISRQTTDLNTPLFMDHFRMTSTTPESHAVSKGMQDGEYGVPEEYEPIRFMSEVYNEIVNIRRIQYANLARAGERRKLEPLKAVQTLDYEPNADEIKVELLILREAGERPIQFRTIINQENFFDLDGRMVLERGLVLLRNTTYERLRTDLVHRQKDGVVSANLLVIR